VLASRALAASLAWLVAPGCDGTGAAPSPTDRANEQAAVTDERTARADERAAAQRARYDRWRRPDLLVPALALRPGDRVADVGAGHGYLVPHLHAAIGSSGRLVATDIDAAALAHLTRRAARDGLSTVEARLVTADDPGLEPGAYDLILLAEVDHLLADRADYFAHLAPALAPGGRIAVANRIPYEQPVREAAAVAGLVAVAASGPPPPQFVVLLSPRDTDAPPHPDEERP
jgi:cyclopropane fatty-acyl-phospholipid synthase-like methyltransferase